MTMVIAVIGSGGKTTLIHRLAQQYRSQGKRVLVTTTTHMYIEKDSLLTDDPPVIEKALAEHGYAMAGIAQGAKLGPLSPETFAAAIAAADVTLVEADGSRQMPLKYPLPTEPVIPDPVHRIILVWGRHGLGRPAKAVCHRLELVTKCLDIEDDTIITPEHVHRLLTLGYLTPLKQRYPHIQVEIHAGDAAEYAVP